MTVSTILLTLTLATPVLQASSPPPAPPPPAAVEAEREEGVTWKKVAHRIGGAVVGGWLGFVGAQVTLSDWEKETNSSFRDQRYSWALGGALLGLLGSHFVSSSFSPGDGRPTLEVAPRDGTYLGESEIRRSEARTAYELIYNTRMQWLITRGVNSVAETPQGEAYGDFNISVTPGRDKIIVYLDDVRLGGVETMRDVPTHLLTSARFLDTREATLRYGGGHAHGAIALSTAVSR